MEDKTGTIETIEDLVSDIRKLTLSFKDTIPHLQGELFNSEYEGYGVMAAEFKCLEDEVFIVKFALDHLLTSGILKEDESRVLEELLTIRNRGLMVCMEMIRLIVMANKFTKTLQNHDD